ncbi:MAG TPA: response regulator, partial [Bacteroidia bacterium]|nr:response regulator [Bacteroidia bacterium]
IVDNDTVIHRLFDNFCLNSEYVSISHYFSISQEFIEKLPFLKLDLCIINTSMPDANGITLARMLPKNSFILLADNDDNLKEAISTEPIDILLKPFSKERLVNALKKAHRLIGNRIEHAFFKVAESDKRVKVVLSDILLVRTDLIDPRNKQIIIKGGTEYTLMDYCMEELLSIAPRLIKVNRRELVSIDAITYTGYDIVAIKGIKPNDGETEITLGPAFKNEFCRRFYFR